LTSFGGFLASKKTPLREAIEEFLTANGPSTIDTLVEKVGRVMVPAPQAVRERRSHLSKDTKTPQEVSTNVEVLVGTRSLVQKALWSCRQSGVVRKNDDNGTYEMVPPDEVVPKYKRQVREGGNAPYRGPRGLSRELVRQLREKLDTMPPYGVDTYDDQERELTKQALHFAERVASAMVQIDSVQVNRRNFISKQRRRAQALADAAR
jgi:hypothetical protein